MTSINTQIKQLSGLLGTTDVTDWELEFIDSICQRTQQGKVVSGLSEKQIEIIERLWRKHYG